MSLDWALVLGILGLLVAVGLVAWSLRAGSRTPVIGAVTGCIVGAGFGVLILTAANQPGLASLVGFVLSIVLGAMALGLAAFGLISKSHRAAALLATGTMVAAAVAASQLLVAATRR